MERPLGGPGPEHHRLGADAGPAPVVDGAQRAEQGRRVPFEPEHAQAADDARDAQVVVVEAPDPVPGRAGEVGAAHDLGARIVVVVVVPGRWSSRPGGQVEAVEVQHAGQGGQESGAEVRAGAEGGEGGAVDDGGGGVVGGGFGEREEQLDVVVAVFEVGVREGEDRGHGAAGGVGGLDGGVVEADEGGGGAGVGGHGGGVGCCLVTGLKVAGACKALVVMTLFGF